MNGKAFKQFLATSDGITKDEKHRKTIAFNMSKYHAAVAKGKQKYADFDLATQRAEAIKRKALQNLDTYLLQFEENVQKNGGEVLWAKTKEEALEYVWTIAEKYAAKKVVKSKSMVTEELELNEFLEKKGIQSIETDLGEYIVQEAGEKPYHIVTPAMHKSKEDIANLFHQKYGTPKDSSPEFLTQYVREKLRKEFVESTVGITGGNFLVADTGGVCVTENEGNGVMITALSKVHIAIVGIEKIIPSYKDLAVLWPLLATNGTGQSVTSYNSMYLGGKEKNTHTKVEKMIVILLDNGRTDLLNEAPQNEALACVRCGACLNACPIYNAVGGYTYNTTYSGPIGSVITPYLKDFETYDHLSFACSLCGKCTEVCMVNIPLHQLLLNNRIKSVENKSKWIWNAGMKGFEVAMKNRNLLDLVGGNFKNQMGNLFAKNALGKEKSLPKFAKKSFSSQYKKTEK